MNRSCSEENQKRNYLATRRSTSLPRPSVYYPDLAYPDFAAVIVRDVACRIRQSAWTSVHEASQPPEKDIKIKSFPDIASIIVGDVLGRVTPGERRKVIKPINECPGKESKADSSIVNIKRKADSSKKVITPPVRSDIIRKSAALESAVKASTLPANLKSLYEGQEYYDTLIKPDSKSPIEGVTSAKPVRSESYFPEAYARTSVPPKYSSTSGLPTTPGASSSSVSQPKYSSVSKLESYCKNQSSNLDSSNSRTRPDFPNYNSVTGLGLNKQAAIQPSYDSNLGLNDYYASTSSWDSANVSNVYQSNDTQNSFSVPKYFSTIGLSGHHPYAKTSVPDSFGQPKYSSTIGIETYKPIAQTFSSNSSAVQPKFSLNYQPQLSAKHLKTNLMTESQYNSVPLLDSYSNKYIEQMNSSGSNIISPSGYSPVITLADSLSDSKKSSSEYVQFISPLDYDSKQKNNSFKMPAILQTKPPLAPKPASQAPFYPQVTTLPQPSMATLSNIPSKSKKKEKRPRSASASRLEDYRQRAAAVIDNAVSKVTATFASLRGRKSRKTKASSNIQVQPNNSRQNSVKDSNTQTDDSFDDVTNCSIDEITERKMLGQVEAIPLKKSSKQKDIKVLLPRTADTIIKIDSSSQEVSPEDKLAAPISIVRVSAVSQNANSFQRRGSCPSFAAAFRSNVNIPKQSNASYIPKPCQHQVNFSDRKHSPKRNPQKVIIKAGIIPPVAEFVKRDRSKSPIDFTELETLIDNINSKCSLLEQENIPPNLSPRVHYKGIGQTVKNNVVKQRNNETSKEKALPTTAGTEIRRSRIPNQYDLSSKGVQNKSASNNRIDELVKQMEEASRPMILRREIKEEARREFYFPNDYPLAKTRQIPVVAPIDIRNNDSLFTLKEDKDDSCKPIKQDLDVLKTHPNKSKCTDKFSHIGPAIVDSSGTGVAITFAIDNTSKSEDNHDMISMIVDDVTNRVSKSVPENYIHSNQSKHLIKTIPHPDIASVIVDDIVGRLTPEEKRKNKPLVSRQIETNVQKIKKLSQEPLRNSKTDSLEGGEASKIIFYPHIGAAIVESSGSGVAITFPGERSPSVQNSCDVASLIIEDVANRITEESNKVKQMPKSVKEQIIDRPPENDVVELKPEIKPLITKKDKKEIKKLKLNIMQDTRSDDSTRYSVLQQKPDCSQLAVNISEENSTKMVENNTCNSKVLNIGIGDRSLAINETYSHIGAAVIESSAPGVAVILATEGEMKDLVENAIDMASFIVHDVTNRVSEEHDATHFSEIKKSYNDNQNELDMPKDVNPEIKIYSLIGPAIVDSSSPVIALLSMGIEDELYQPFQEAPLVASIIVSDVARRIIADRTVSSDNLINDNHISSFPDNSENVMEKNSFKTKSGANIEQNATEVFSAHRQSSPVYDKPFSPLNATILSTSEVSVLPNGVDPSTDANVKDLAYTLPVSSIQEAQFIKFSSKIGLISPLTVHETQEIKTPCSADKGSEFTKIISSDTINLRDDNILLEDKLTPVIFEEDLGCLIPSAISYDVLENVIPLKSDFINEESAENSHLVASYFMMNDDIKLFSSDEKLFYSFSEASIPSGYETVSEAHSLDEGAEIIVESDIVEMEASNICKPYSDKSDQREILNNDLPILSSVIDTTDNSIPAKETLINYESFTVNSLTDDINQSKIVNNELPTLSDCISQIADEMPKQNYEALLNQGMITCELKEHSADSKENLNIDLSLYNAEFKRVLSADENVSNVVGDINLQISSNSITDDLTANDADGNEMKDELTTVLFDSPIVSVSIPPIDIVTCEGILETNNAVQKDILNIDLSSDNAEFERVLSPDENISNVVGDVNAQITSNSVTDDLKANDGDGNEMEDEFSTVLFDSPIVSVSIPPIDIAVSEGILATDKTVQKDSCDNETFIFAENIAEKLPVISNNVILSDNDASNGISTSSKEVIGTNTTIDMQKDSLEVDNFEAEQKLKDLKSDYLDIVADNNKKIIILSVEDSMASANIEMTKKSNDIETPIPIESSMFDIAQGNTSVENFKIEEKIGLKPFILSTPETEGIGLDNEIVLLPEGSLPLGNDPLSMKMGYLADSDNMCSSKQSQDKELILGIEAGGKYSKRISFDEIQLVLNVSIDNEVPSCQIDSSLSNDKSVGNDSVNKMTEIIEINQVEAATLSANKEIPLINEISMGLENQIPAIISSDDVIALPLIDNSSADEIESSGKLIFQNIVPLNQSGNINSTSDTSEEENSSISVIKGIILNIEKIEPVIDNEFPIKIKSTPTQLSVDDKLSETTEVYSSNTLPRSVSPIRVVSIALSTDKTTTVVTPSEATNHLIATKDVTVSSPLSLGTLCALSIAKAPIVSPELTFSQMDEENISLLHSEWPEDEIISVPTKSPFTYDNESQKIDEEIKNSELDSFLMDNEKNPTPLGDEKTSSFTSSPNLMLNKASKYPHIAAAIVDSAPSLVAVSLSISGATAIDYPDLASSIVSNILDRIAINEVAEDNNNVETMPNANMLNYSGYPEIVDEVVNRIEAETRLAGVRTSDLESNRTRLTYPDIASAIVRSVAGRVEMASSSVSENPNLIETDDSLPSSQISYSDLASAVAREVVSRAEANKLEGTTRKVPASKLPDKLDALNNTQLNVENNLAMAVTEAILDTTEKSTSDIAQAIVHDVIIRLTGDLGDEPDIVSFSSEIELEDKNSDLAASIVDDVVNRIIIDKNKNISEVQTNADLTYPDIAAAMIHEIVDRIKQVDKNSITDTLKHQELQTISYANLASAVIKTVVSKIEDTGSSSKESNESNISNLVDDYSDVISVIAAESPFVKSTINEKGETFVYLPMYIAAEKNRLFWIKELLESMGDANEQNENGDTALHIASLKGYLDIVNALCINPKNMCDVNIRNYDGNTALHQACSKGHYEIAFALLKAGSDVNARNIEQGLAPLHFACHHDIKLVQLLIENGAEINIREYSQRYSPLLIACMTNNYAVAELLVCSGCEMAVKDIVGKSSLHHVFNHNLSRPSVPLVKLLVEAGCEVNAIDDDDKTPLIYACESECPEAVAVLLEHGANASFMRPDGSLPMKFAVESNNAVLVELLLKYGASPNISSLQETDYPPIVYAAYYNVNDVIKVLLNYNCEIDRCDENGNTALHRACGNNSISIVKELLNYGADVEKTSSSGQTALHIASRYGFIEIIQIILEHGCNVNACNEYGWSAIHWAVHKGFVDIVKILIKAGSELHTFKEESVFGVGLEKELLRFRSGDERPFIMNLEVLLMLLSAGYNISQDKIFQPIETYLVDLDTEIVEDNEEFFELLMILSGQPQPLIQLCGHAIRKLFGPDLVKKVPQLELPETLKQFLLFENLFTSWSEFYEVKAEGVTMIAKIV